jgi:hypothetical protein
VRYLESVLAHEFVHAIDYLSGDYDDFKNGWEPIIRRTGEFEGWDEETIIKKLQEILDDEFEPPALDIGYKVDEELRELWDD